MDLSVQSETDERGEPTSGQEASDTRPEFNYFELCDIRDWKSLCAQMRAEAEGGGLSPGRRIEEVVGKRLWARICACAEADSADIAEQEGAASVLNIVLEKRDFYKADYFPEIELSDRAENELLAYPTDTWTDEGYCWLNAQLLEACYAQIKPCHFAPPVVSWRASWEGMCDEHDYPCDGPNLSMNDGRVLSWSPYDEESYSRCMSVFLSSVFPTIENEGSVIPLEQHLQTVIKSTLDIEARSSDGETVVRLKSGESVVWWMDEFERFEQAEAVKASSQRFRDYVLGHAEMCLRVEVVQIEGPSVENPPDGKPEPPSRKEPETTFPCTQWNDPSMEIDMAGDEYRISYGSPRQHKRGRREDLGLTKGDWQTLQGLANSDGDLNKAYASIASISARQRDRDYKDALNRSGDDLKGGHDVIDTKRTTGLPNRTRTAISRLNDHLQSVFPSIGSRPIVEGVCSFAITPMSPDVRSDSIGDDQGRTPEEEGELERLIGESDDQDDGMSGPSL